MDTAAFARWWLEQVGTRLAGDLASLEAVIKQRKQALPRGRKVDDPGVTNLGRIRSEIKKSTAEVERGLMALEPDERDPSKALGMADSLVARLDHVSTLLEETIEAHADSDEPFKASLAAALERSVACQQEATFAFDEVFEATW